MAGRSKSISLTDNIQAILDRLTAALDMTISPATATVIDALHEDLMKGEVDSTFLASLRERELNERYSQSKVITNLYLQDETLGKAHQIGERLEETTDLPYLRHRNQKYSFPLIARVALWWWEHKNPES